ncbi:MAG: hypothetical protein HYX32_10750, partial [Actinobacteria bacterium]|nr:hypothetical protein [Actinomycetota bacterium]
MTDAELTWLPPGDGFWRWAGELVPRPACGLLAAIFPPVTAGSSRSAARYGLPAGDVRWRSVNGYLYVSVGPADPETFPQLEDAARETLGSRRWREEAQQWFGVARARV